MTFSEAKLVIQIYLIFSTATPLILYGIIQLKGKK